MKKVIAKIKKREKIKLSTSDIISAISAGLTLISVVFVALTLHEMKIERNAAYMPKILLNPAEISFSWDENGKETRYNLKDNENNDAFEMDENGNIKGTLEIPISYLSDYNSEKIDVVNLGVGNARDVVFEWNEDNLTKLNNCLIECDPTKRDFLKVDKSAVFDFDGNIIMTDTPLDHRIMYMLANAQETYKLTLPMAYSILIHEIIKSSPYDKELPYLILTAKYFDVQGNEHNEVFLVQIKRLISTTEKTGAGEAVYQLIPAIQKS